MSMVGDFSSVNESVRFVGRTKETKQLTILYKERRHVLVIGPAGIGKTALLRHVRQSCPFFHCEETSSLRRICDGIEGQLGWTRYKLNVVERKNRLLAYLGRRGEPVVFDHVALTAPRVARFMGYLAEEIPVWIACRSDHAAEIGRVWEHLYKFARLELAPLTRKETRFLIEQAVVSGHIQADAGDHAARLHSMSHGNARILEELLIELATREYKMETSFGSRLLDLDRRIREITTSVEV